MRTIHDSDHMTVGIETDDHDHTKVSVEYHHDDGTSSMKTVILPEHVRDKLAEELAGL